MLTVLTHPWQGAVLEWSSIVLWVAACAVTAHYCCGVLGGITVWWKAYFDYFFWAIWLWFCGYVAVIVFFYRRLLHCRLNQRQLLLGRLLNLAYHCVRWPIFFSLCSSESLYLLAVAYYFDTALALLTIPYWIVRSVRHGCCCCCAFHENPSCRAGCTFCACCQGAAAGEASDEASEEASDEASDEATEEASETA